MMARDRRTFYIRRISTDVERRRHGLLRHHTDRVVRLAGPGDGGPRAGRRARRLGRGGRPQPSGPARPARVRVRVLRPAGPPPLSACSVLSGGWPDRAVRHVYECQMRRADLHGDTVSNVAFVDYLQEARLDLLRHHDTSPTPNPGEGLVVVNTVVDYLAPLRLADAPLSVSVWSTQVRAASFTLGYELFTGPADDPVVHARATTLLTPFVFSEGRPRPLAREERARAAPGARSATACPAPRVRLRCPPARHPGVRRSGTGSSWSDPCTSAS